jgi:predicted phage replisome organizer
LQKINQIVRGDKVADVKWIKIVTDIFNDEKISLIETLPDGDSIIVIWFKLLCLAGQKNNGGVFFMKEKVPYTEEMLSAIFRRPLNTVRFAIKTFEQYGMIEIIDNVITIPNWSKHQSEAKLSEMREYNRIAKRAERERRKALVDGAENKSLPAENKQTQEEKENVNDKSMTSQDSPLLSISVSKSFSQSNVPSTKGKKNPLILLIEEYTDNDDLIESINGFIEMRKKMKKELTERALKIILKKLEPFSDKEKIKIIDKSVENNWIGVYTESKEQYQKPTQKQTASSKLMEMIRREENEDAGNEKSVIDADYFIPKF